MKIHRFHFLLWRVLAGIGLCGLGGHALANPTGMTVASGTATASQSGARLTITTSPVAMLNWQSFNIAAGETTIFNQPSISSVVINRINDQNPSQIYGSLQANGLVVLMNSAGFYFGPNSFVSAGGGLIISTANCIPPRNNPGGTWEFNGSPPLSSIINFGKINVGQGSSAYLIAENIFNYGSINAPGGEVGLAAGQHVVLSDRPDGRGLSMTVNLPEGSVDNYGHITADAGTIAMNARSVNQDGLVQANSVRNENGVIELVASDQLNLGANSQILANGDASVGGSSGGSVTLQSGNSFSDATGSQIDVTGGSQGGNGGNVEISAPNILSLNSIIDARAQSGWTAGKLALDPGYIILDDSGTGSAGNGTVLAGNSSTSTLDLNVIIAFANLAVSDIILQAVNDITLAGGTTWDLSGTIGANLGGVTGGQLTLEAGRNIIFGDGSSISDGTDWSVSLMAGVNNFTTGTIHNGTGNIYLGGGDGQSGSGSIQTFSGSISLSAGSGIQIGSGVVNSGTGNITWKSGGDIQFGDGSSISDGNNGVVTLDAGYDFAGSTVQLGVGNIYLNGDPSGDGVGGSIQAAAGDPNTSDAINLVAGQDITVGSGYVITTGGGNISAHALAGSVDAGSDAQGYHFIGNASSLNAAYSFQNGLGGISTEAGGNVTLIAGSDVTSVLPGKGVYYYDGGQVTPDNPNGRNDYLTAGSGAYGSQPGNVTIVAGGNVTGNYLVANGVGSIFAGVQMDANGNPITDASGNYLLGASGSAGTDLKFNGLALSLITGGWNVAAAQNILLQEVRNPNGVFNSSGVYSHYFNYAPGDYVNLSAGNLVQLGAASTQLPRLSGANNNVPVIYPSILNIMSGAGGVILGASGSPSSLALFPSPEGSLTIDTAGSLVSALSAIQGAPQLFNLIVSDAGHSQFTMTANFGASDHAASPIHLNSPTPIDLNIGGDMDYINLNVPEAAQINVGGNMNNCGFQGINLSSGPSFQVQIPEADGGTYAVTVNPGVTSINVAGDLFSRGNFTSVDISQVAGAQGLGLSDLAQAITGPGQPSAITLASSFYYNPSTELLTYQDIPGISLINVLKLLNNLTIQKYVNGVPQWSDPFDTIPVTETVSVLGDPATPGTAAYALLNQYNNLSALPYALPNSAGSYGYTLGGGGQFDITARTIDLGTSAGIQSEGVAAYTIRGVYPLAGLFGNGGQFAHGADINIATTGNESAGVNAATGDLIGDLDMLSSSIASVDGGNISINVGGAVNAGSSVFSASSLGARGIYTTAQSDVSVIASGDVNLNGSRIATYDGGNITVESLNGSVNVGTGASTPVPLTGYYEDPVTHRVYADSVQLPFSGIVALTFPARDSSYPAPDAILGNILVEAPNGSVNADAAGILQIALNHLNYPDAVTTVLAGFELRDAGGNAVLAADSEKAVIELLPVSTDDLSDPPRTAIVDGTKYQLSATVWSELLAVLGSPGDSQVVNLHVIGDPTVFLAALLGDGTGLASSINYQSLVSAGRNINVGGSGIIASNARLDASGNINGLIFARNNIDIIAQQNINVSALGVGNVNVNSSSGTISGNYIGVGGVSVSATTVDANLVSANIVGSTSGQSGLGQGGAAAAASQGLANSASTQAAAASEQGADDEQKKKGKEIALAQKVSRVTVILPPKKVSETQIQNHGT